MKINELLRRLENVEPVENFDNERRELAEYIAQVFFKMRKNDIYHIMLKDKRIYEFGWYTELVKIQKVSPKDIYVYIEHVIYRSEYISTLYHFLDRIDFLVYAYLSKLGFCNYRYSIAPATGIKYVARAHRSFEQFVVEAIDINTAVTNVKLSRMINGNLDNKALRKHNYYISGDNIDKMVQQLILQRLFAGYNVNEAKEIVRRYYVDNDTSLAKEVDAIKDAYYNVFQPYRIEYDM